MRIRSAVVSCPSRFTTVLLDFVHYRALTLNQGHLLPWVGVRPTEAKTTKPREENTMALREGQVYRCPDESCASEITVTKGARPTCQSQQNPICCCGKTMELVG